MLSQELQAGDLVLGLDGKYRQIVRIEQRYERQIRVANLTVRNHHTFAVGDDMVLVHNESFCEILEKAKGPLKNFKALLKAAQRENVLPHPHHIVPKNPWEYRIAGRAAVPYIEKAQKILELCDIDWLKDPKNLTWALNWDHSLDYVKAVTKALEDAYKTGLEDGKEVQRRPLKRRLRKLRRY